MRPLLPILGLARRREQQLFYQSDIAVEQKAAVKEQRALFAVLRVAGDFSSAERQVAKARDGYRLIHQRRERERQRAHDIAIGRRDFMEPAGSDIQNEGIVQATRRLYDGGAAARPAEDG